MYALHTIIITIIEHVADVSCYSTDVRLINIEVRLLGRSWEGRGGHMTHHAVYATDCI